MHTNHKREDPLVELGYEVRDIEYKPLIKGVVYFFAFTLATFIVGYWIYNAMNPLKQRQTQVNNASSTRRIPNYPNPLLQNNVTAKTDMMLMRKQEAQRLEGTGYVEGTNQGRVHIPVERAIDLLAERGLPQTGQDVPAVSRGNTTDQDQAFAASPAPTAGTATPGASPVPATPAPSAR